MATVSVVTEDTPSGIVLETRLYEDGYGTITILDNLGFELRQYESRSFAYETVEEFHDRLAEMLALEGDIE